MLDLTPWPLWGLITAFAVSAVIIGVVGTKMTAVAEALARRTGLGQAVFGAVFLGGSTSLPGITTSIVAAAGGSASLAVSNAIGGIAAQTAFLAIADMAYRKVNLEHAAANIANLMQGALLVTLISLPMLATAYPDFALFGVHPVSPVILLAYVFGIRLVSGARTEPMWAPKSTPETRLEEDEPHDEEAKPRPLWLLWMFFALQGLVVGFAGYVVARTGMELSSRTGLSESVVGTYFTALATSLPELVTAVAAVRRGALTLAVGDVLGGNCFDLLFIAAADVAFRSGSIYAAIGSGELFTMALTILLTGILLLGLLRREKHGIGNIGFESFLVLLLYIGAGLLLAFGGPAQ